MTKPSDAENGPAFGHREMRVDVSPSRLVLAVGIFCVLAVLFGALAVEVAGARPLSAVFFALLAVITVYAAVRIWSLRTLHLILTADELRSNTGRVLCRVDEIKGIERGMMAFKPSGGFIIRLKARRSRAWAPGIWWRLGRSIGVGGVTISGQARAMADVLSARLSGQI